MLLITNSVKAHSRLNRQNLKNQTTACWTTGQFSTHAPQPVQRSMSIVRAFFLTLTLKLPGSPSTASRSAYVINSMFKCRPTSTSLGEMIHIAQSLVGKVLSNCDMIPPIEGDFSSKYT